MTKFKSLIALFSIFILAFTFMSSKDIKPKTENYETLKKFVEENFLPIKLEKCLYVKSLEDFKEFGFYRLYNAKKKNISKIIEPDLFVFNEDFLMIDENALGGCFINRSEFTKANRDYYTEILEKNKLWEEPGRDKPCSLEMLRGNLINYQGNSVFPFKENKPCILILWKKRKSTVEDIKFINAYTRLLLAKSKTEVPIYFLNIDNYSY